MYFVDLDDVLSARHWQWLHFYFAELYQNTNASIIFSILRNKYL